MNMVRDKTYHQHGLDIVENHELISEDPAAAPEMFIQTIDCLSYAHIPHSN